MTADSVDDLHAAEELAVQTDPTYCRPSCIDNATFGGCEDDAECDCPCHHRGVRCDSCGQLGWGDLEVAP